MIFFFFLLIDKFSSNAYYSTACVFLRVSYSLVVSYSKKKKKTSRLYSGCLHRKAVSGSRYWKFKKLFFTFEDDRIEFPSVNSWWWVFAKSSTFRGWTPVIHAATRVSAVQQFSSWLGCAILFPSNGGKKSWGWFQVIMGFLIPIDPIIMSLSSHDYLTNKSNQP